MSGPRSAGSHQLQEPRTIPWTNQELFTNPVPYTCGHCGIGVSAAYGFRRSDSAVIRIGLCPHCSKPSFFEPGNQLPGVRFGEDVQHLPPDIDGIYREARNCMAVEAFTAGALACRKILMNIAVNTLKAKEGERFAYYVDELDKAGYIPPNGKAWVKHIKDKGNEATHEIPAIQREDLADLIVFSGMLLKFIFEFPNRLASAGS